MLTHEGFDALLQVVTWHGVWLGGSHEVKCTLSCSEMKFIVS